MVSLANAGSELFGKEIPSLDELKKLWPQVNSSERTRAAILEKARQHKDPLAAGLGLLFCGQTAEAAEKLEQASDCAAKHMGLGQAYRQLKQYDKSLRELDKAVKKNADAMTAAMEKAATHRAAGNPEAAEKELAPYTNFENVSAEYHFQRGKVLDAQGEYEKAIANYQIAIDLDPSHAEARFALAYASDLRGDEEAAIVHYKHLIKMQPTHVNALLNLAVLYEDQDDYEKASRCVEAVLVSHPNHPKALLFSKDIESSKVMIYDEEREKRRDRQNKILEIPISDFELSVRSRNCLKKMNIETIGDLLRTTEADLLSYKNFGETSLLEIKKILDSKGLRLGMALEDKNTASGETAAVQGASQELLAKPVDDLELSVRARRALSRLNVKTILELINKTEAELLGCKNFGVTSLNEIKDKLSQFGLSLRNLE
jgi:DNA-directed RNA polymerase subunit alpha